MGAANLSPTLLQLIRALAEDAAREDYLAAQASREPAQGDERTNHVPLPATERAA